MPNVYNKSKGASLAPSINAEGLLQRESLDSYIETGIGKSSADNTRRR